MLYCLLFTSCLSLLRITKTSLRDGTLVFPYTGTPYYVIVTYPTGMKFITSSKRSSNKSSKSSSNESGSKKSGSKKSGSSMNDSIVYRSGSTVYENGSIDGSKSSSSNESGSTTSNNRSTTSNMYNSSNNRSTTSNNRSTTSNMYNSSNNMYYSSNNMYNSNKSTVYKISSNKSLFYITQQCEYPYTKHLCKEYEYDMYMSTGILIRCIVISDTMHIQELQDWISVPDLSMTFTSYIIYAVMSTIVYKVFMHV